MFGANPWRPPTALILAALAIALGAGCGTSNDDDPGGARRDALVAKLPRGDVVLVAAADLSAARRLLGLPADADAADVGSDGPNSPRARLAGVAASVLPYLGSADDNALRTAIDYGRVTAVASLGGLHRRGAAVLATTQSFDEIAATLARAGYRRTGGLLVAPSSRERIIYPVVGHDGDDVVALGHTPDVVREMLARETAVPEVQAAWDLTKRAKDAPAAAALVNPFAGGCLQAVAQTNSVQPRGGEFIVRTAPPPTPDDLALDERSPGVLPSYRFDPPDVDGDALIARYREDPESPVLPFLVAGDLPTPTVVHC